MRTTITKPVEVTEVTCDWCGAFMRNEVAGISLLDFWIHFTMGLFEFHNEVCYKAAVAAIQPVLEEARKGVRA